MPAEVFLYETRALARNRGRPSPGPAARSPSAARCNRCIGVTDDDLHAAVQLTPTGVAVAGHREGLAIALRADPVGIDAPHDASRLDRLVALFREVLVVGIAAHTVGEALDLHAPVRVLVQERGETVQLHRGSGIQARPAG